MKAGVYRFKTFEEANRFYIEHWLERGNILEEINTFEYIRLKVKAYLPGMYRYKTIEEKQKDMVRRVIKAEEERRWR